MVGHFGRTIKNLGNQGPISRVTSLDPAKPWFDLSEASNKVSKDDAELVDVVHTNSGFLLDVSKGCVILFANIALLWESLYLQLKGFLRKKSLNLNEILVILGYSLFNLGSIVFKRKSWGCRFFP